MVTSLILVCSSSISALAFAYTYDVFLYAFARASRHSCYQNSPLLIASQFCRDPCWPATSESKTNRTSRSSSREITVSPWESMRCPRACCYAYGPGSLQDTQSSRYSCYLTIPAPIAPHTASRQGMPCALDVITWWRLARVAMREAT
eukprot:6188640-Pleurochrysis_carterae.AAC.2